MTSGPLSVPLDLLRTMLSESATFQTWVAAADATEALDSIHLVELEEGDVVRPLAVIDIGEEWSSTQFAAGVNGTFINSGQLLLFFEADVAEGATEGEAVIAFLDEVGGCIQDIQVLSGQGGYISIHSVEMAEPPMRAVDDEEPPEGDFYRIKFVIEWGV